MYTVRWRHPTWYGEVFRLWRLGLNDGQIGRVLGKTPNAIWTARHGMGLEANAAPGERTFPEVPYSEQQPAEEPPK